MREKLLLDFNWLFHDGDIEIDLPPTKLPLYTQAKTEHAIWGPASFAYPDQGERCLENWEQFDLPHDYIIRQRPQPQNNDTLGYFDYHNAWYRRHFYVPASDRERRLLLYFEGVATHAVVYVNGCEMARNFCGYTPFTIDISDIVRFDADNVIAVHVLTNEHEGWWYEGAGIYRHVWLIKTASVAVDQWGVWVNPRKTEGQDWLVPVETTLVNDRLETAVVQVNSALVDPHGQLLKEISSSLEIPGKGKAVLQHELWISDPQLWDIESPCLYEIQTTIFGDDQQLDTQTTRFGFRTIHFSAQNGFFLNGRSVKIKGVCCHQDYGLTGKAMPDRVHHYRLRRLKEMGANGYRAAHYPPAEATMDALDELGFLVMDETRWFSSTPEGLAQLETMLKRDRNHPSVILWSMGNEEPLHRTEAGRRIMERMTAFVHQYDTSRPVTTAISHQPLQAPAVAASEVIGINYNLEQFDQLHALYPEKPIVVSECCAVGTTRGWYWPDDTKRGYFSAYDHVVGFSPNDREDTWRFVMARDWVAGAYQWAGIEHRGETVWPRLCSQSGALDLFLQPKDAYYQNQSHWTEKPMVHILPHWNQSHRAGETLLVWVYSNCAELDLFQDGVSQGRQKPERFAPGIWSLHWSPGMLRAVGYQHGKDVVEASVATTGPAVALCLQLEDDDVRADGEDVAIVTCTCLDRTGQFVPDAVPYIHFDTNGLGAILGTGSDVCDHRPVTEQDRQMRAGRCAVIVKAGFQPGILRIYAQAEGLEPAALAVKLSDVQRRPFVA